jgi:integrative and conjugative element protein (TIGR02256 family)
MPESLNRPVRYCSKSLGLCFQFDPAVIEHFGKHRQAHFWNFEAGGQLFATKSAAVWQIKQASGPRVSDLRSRFGFIVNRRAEQAEINVQFNSNLHYVGDWHTHPERRPSPSETDIVSMKELATESRYELPGFLMIIVGNDPNSSELWVSFNRRNGGYERLSMSNDDVKNTGPISPK